MMANPEGKFMKAEKSANLLITEVFRQPLMESLSMVPAFLAQMVQLNLITVDQDETISNVLAQHGSRDATRVLLKLIHQGQQYNVVSQFVLALKQSGDATNALLADLIEGISNIPEYNKEHQLIKKYYHRLQDINPIDVLPHLTYIGLDDKLSIMRKCEIGYSNLARSTLLHLTVRTLEPRWFEIFVHALEQTGHGIVARDMRLDMQTETAVETEVRQMPSPPECQDETSLNLDSLSLDDNREQRNAPQDLRAPGASISGTQHQEERRQDSQPQAMAPPTHTVRDRSRSSKRSNRGDSRQSSRSPKRPRTYQGRMNLFKRKRSRSRENSQQGWTYNQMIVQQQVQNNYYHSTTHNTANITNSHNVQAMVGGEGNTMNIGSQRNGWGPVPGGEVDMDQDARPRGEDQPDRAKVPRVDDISDVHGVPSHGGYQSPHWAKSNIPKTERPLLYDDQLELAEDAVRGMNTVLVAPTGSGKTHVAAYIIHDHFITDRPKPVKERRALFLVTTVNLVGQQQDKLKSLLQPAGLFSVVGIHGASELSLREEAVNRNVIVLTAQLLENALTSDIRLDHFSLLVFDECHLCQKGHAYNTIMARYLDEELQGNSNLPQVVGMTASLGTGKAKWQADADRHAVQICANMNAHSISMVTRNVEALEARVNIPKEVEPIEVRCREIDPFADKINEIMEKIEIMLKESPNPAIRDHVGSESMPSQRGSQAYRQWCDRMKRSAQTFIQDGKEGLYRTLQTCITHLMDYNSALLINKQVRTKDAYNFLREKMDVMNERRTCFDDTDVALWTLFVKEEGTLEDIKDDPSNENPLLEKLSEIIQEEFENRPHSRAILFVKTIDTTEALHDWITETPELAFLNPGRIAGSRDMNSKQQNEVIEQFRSGEHKMLVATNLLEQGTDVPACNLVIRLDYVPSDFGHVQIKGRTRAKDGRSYLITLVDSRGAVRDSTNRQREVMMMEAAQNLKGKASGEFLDLMRHQQSRDRDVREARQEQKREILQENQGEVFIFCCINCSTAALQSCDIRIFGDSQYLILDRSFQGRMKVKPHPKPKKLGKDCTIIGKMFCKTCGHDWGALARIQDSYYPSVRISQFSLKNLRTDEARTYKKWKEAPFAVGKIADLPLEAKINVPTDVLKKLRKL